MQIFYIILGIVVVAVLAGIAGQYWYVNTKLEKPKYKTISTHGGYEVRAYEPYIIASTEVLDTDQVMNTGFSIVADYIFGNNTREGASEPVAMTAPVFDQVKQNESITMTAPVLDEAGKNGTRIVSFVMPSRYTRATLPKPNNPKVQITQVPAETWAVSTYSGLTSSEKKQEQYKKLVKQLDEDGVFHTEEWKAASYDPPSTIPFLRTHEIWIKLER